MMGKTTNRAHGFEGVQFRMGLFCPYLVASGFGGTEIRLEFHFAGFDRLVHRRGGVYVFTVAWCSFWACTIFSMNKN